MPWRETAGVRNSARAPVVADQRRLLDARGLSNSIRSRPSAANWPERGVSAFRKRVAQTRAAQAR